MRKPIIHTLAEAASIARLSLRQLQREIAAERGPVVTILSTQRRGIAQPDLTQWLKARRRRVDRRLKEAA